MFKRLKIAFLIMCMILVSVPLSVSAAAVTVTNGIGVTSSCLSETRLNRGDTFTVCIKSPVNQDADDLHVYVEYDPEVLELVKWQTDTASAVVGPDLTTNPNPGYFSVAVSTAASGGAPDTPQLRFSTTPLSLTATMRVKTSARPEKVGNDYVTSLNLKTYSINRINRGADPSIAYYAPIQLWGDTLGAVNTEAKIYIDPPTFPIIGTGDGLTVDKTIVDCDETLKVFVKVPLIAWDAENPIIKILYDNSIFDFANIKWNKKAGTPISGIDAATGSNFFGLKLSNADLNAPLDLEAELTPISTNKNENCTFTLKPEISDNNIAYWEPDPSNITRTVTATALPVIDGGMSVDKTTVKRGEKVTATITVPSVIEPADHGEFEISFDPSAFSVTKWEPALGTPTVDNINGKLGLTVDGAVDLTGGYTFTAELVANEDAELGSIHDFTLSKAAFTRTEAGRKQKIWIPDPTKKSATVEIYGDFPVQGKNSITAAPASLDPGSEFTVTVTVPEINAKADAIDLAVNYDPNMFEITGVTSSIPSLTVNNLTPGKFFINESNIIPKVDFSSGLTITANAKVKYTAKKGSYDFTLNPASITYKKASGAAEKIWNPYPTKATVTIKSDSTSFPVTSDGISVSSSRVKPNGTFTATVKVPALNAIGHAFNADVLFDPNIFSIQSVSCANTGVHTTYGDGWFSAEGTGGNIDLKNGITVTAQMKVNNDAVVGKSYNLELSKMTGLTGALGTGAPSQELWKPQITVATVKVPSPEDDFPVSGGGLSLSQSSVYTGDQFTLYIKIPAMDISADNASFTVDFDGSVFDVISWDPRLSGSVPTYSTGSISLTASGASNLNLRNGLSFYATLKVKDSARTGTYQFRLSKYSVTAAGISKELWSPVTVYEPITVSSRSNNNNNNNNPWNNYPYPNYWYPNYNPNNTYPNNNTPVIIYRDDKDDKRGDIVYYDDNDASTIAQQDDEISNSTQNNIRIDLDGNLRNVNNSGIKANTKKKFFSGDTLIIIRNTDLADRSASEALSQLSMQNCQSYAFDISVFDYATGKYIHTINGGYIDISIPVPNTFTGKQENIAVYHVDDGNPEYIQSEVSYEDGIKKIKFRANSFSPYMFVDPTSTKSGNNSSSGSNSTYTIPNSNTDNNGGYTGGDSTGTGSRPANPSTGSTVALILIPTATLGCVLLARKSKKRKRSQRR